MIEALAERLVALAPPGTARVQLTTSRAAAVHAARAAACASKLGFVGEGADRDEARNLVIVREGADHGAPDLPTVRVANTKQLGSGLSPWRLGQSLLAQLQRTIETEDVAMVLFEPIQHAGGCLYAPPDYWPAVRELCDRYGIVLAIDEAVTGLGRLGAWFAADLLEVRADLIVLGEGLTAGQAPIGAVLAHERLAAALGPHDLSPASAALALDTLDRLQDEGILENVRRQAPWFADRLAGRILPLPAVADVRGAGLMWAVELHDQAIVQLAPPLTSGRGELDELIERLERVLARQAPPRGTGRPRRPSGSTSR